jgi:hypothetical protein
VAGSGTSAVAPLWAGLMARINQRLGWRVGTASEFLYEPSFAATFKDVTVGSNGSPTSSRSPAGERSGRGPWELSPMRACSRSKALACCCGSTPGGLIPLEIYELAQHFTVPKLVVALVKHADRLVPGSARAVALRRFSRSPNLPK